MESARHAGSRALQHRQGWGAEVRAKSSRLCNPTAAMRETRRVQTHAWDATADRRRDLQLQRQLRKTPSPPPAHSPNLSRTRRRPSLLRQSTRLRRSILLDGSFNDARDTRAARVPRAGLSILRSPAARSRHSNLAALPPPPPPAMPARAPAPPL